MRATWRFVHRHPSPSVATRGGTAVLSPDYHPRPRCPVRDLYNPCVRSFVVPHARTKRSELHTNCARLAHKTMRIAHKTARLGRTHERVDPRRDNSREASRTRRPRGPFLHPLQLACFWQRFVQGPPGEVLSAKFMVRAALSAKFMVETLKLNATSSTHEQLDGILSAFMRDEFGKHKVAACPPTPLSPPPPPAHIRPRPHAHPPTSSIFHGATPFCLKHSLRAAEN